MKVRDTTGWEGDCNGRVQDWSGRIFIEPFIIGPKQSFNIMGTLCSPEQQKEPQFTASFSANLRELYEYYKAVIQFLKPSSLFASSSEELTVLIETYLQNPKTFPKDNMGLCSVDSVSKVHPLAYGTEVTTKQWLLDGCLRQNKFIQDFPIQLLDFQESYRHYVQFLYMCFKDPSSVIVPNKLADFMWHAHMQDNYRYKADSMKMLGRVLDHYDDLTPQEMEKHQKLTEEARKRLLRVPERKGLAIAPSSGGVVSYHEFGFINYGPGYCGGGHTDRHSHHQHHDHRHSHHHHHHDDKNHHDHHDHHKQESNSNHHGHHSNNHHDYSGGNTHHDTGNNHSSCGGGGASSCGGGASSCGGGGSSCGGGGSSCGGGGGD